MSDYHQPDFYRFNQDSLALVEHIKTQIAATPSILDLGAGCGIIGIELGRYFLPPNVTFLELQSEYRPFLTKNIEQFLPAEVMPEVYFDSFSTWEPQKRWELIVCNPPYFLPGHGRPSKDSCRALARSFSVSGWKVLSKLIVKCLTPAGNAFVVIKDDPLIYSSMESSFGTDMRFQVKEGSGLKFIRIAGFGS